MRTAELSRLDDRALPQNLRAERSVLASILLDNHAFHTAIKIVDSPDFFLEAHRHIFVRIIVLAEENRAIDLATLHEELEQAGELEAVGGSAYLSALVDDVPCVSNVDQYARIVHEKAMRRAALRETANLEDACRDEARALPDVLRQAGATIQELERKARTPARTASSAEDGAALLCDAEKFISRYAVLPPGVPLLAALWAIGTHLFAEFDGFAYLALLSPIKRCGKTRLLEVLELLVAQPRRSAGISEAALFRLVEKESPTLLLDEQEFLSGRSERAEFLRGLLNAGARRGSTVIRCVGSNHDLAEFSVYCPKVFAAIGRLPDTLADRSIVVNMQRQQPEERAARFVFRHATSAGEELRGRIATWVSGNGADIQAADDSIELPWLEDRAEECWRPLFALLSVADHGRVGELRATSERASARQLEADEDENIKLRLLSDIRQVWPDGESRIFTADLLCRLRRVEDAPWAAEFGLNPRKLARLLRPFGIERRSVRVGTATGKGYILEELSPAFSRYLPRKGSQRSQPNFLAASEPFSDGSHNTVVTLGESAEEPAFSRCVTLVTDSELEAGAEGEESVLQSPPGGGAETEAPEGSEGESAWTCPAGCRHGTRREHIVAVLARMQVRGFIGRFADETLQDAIDTHMGGRVEDRP